MRYDHEYEDPCSPLFLLVVCMVAVPAAAMINPSAGYCTALGYQYVDVAGADGSLTGYCNAPREPDG